MTTLTTRPPTTHRMTAEPGVRFGIANGLLVATFVAASIGRLDPTETGWTAVVAAGLLGVGLSLSMTASLGVIAWAWFTGFVENRYGELTFAGDDLRRLVLFAASALALAVFTRHILHLIQANAHG